MGSFYRHLAATQKFLINQMRKNSSCRSLITYPTQTYSPAFLLDLKDFHINDIADAQDRTCRDLRAVEQSILFNANIHESTEVDDIPYGSLKFHS
jgi:hypothetical protein